MNQGETQEIIKENGVKLFLKQDLTQNSNLAPGKDILMGKEFQRLGNLYWREPGQDLWKCIPGARLRKIKYMTGLPVTLFMQVSSHRTQGSLEPWGMAPSSLDWLP